MGDTPPVYGGVSPVLGGSITVLNLALKWGKSISMGEVLYSIKWVKHEPQKTHNTHTTTNMSSHCPTLRQLCPFLSMGRAKLPPNHGTTAPQRHKQAKSHRGCAQWCWFACLGGAKSEALNNWERVDALALGGCRLFYKPNNQPMVGVDIRGCFGEEVMMDHNMWRWCSPIVWGSNGATKKLK